MTIPIERVGTFETLPLDDAVKALRALDPKDDSPKDQIRKDVWRAAEWFSMATGEQDPVMKFMKSFPPIELLASCHYQDLKENDISSKAILDDVVKYIKSKQAFLGERLTAMLVSRIKAVPLSTKFEKFVVTRLPNESTTILQQFSQLGKVRNPLFHSAQNDLVDHVVAEETRRLLFQCIKAEIVDLISSNVE